MESLLLEGFQNQSDCISEPCKFSGMSFCTKAVFNESCIRLCRAYTTLHLTLQSHVSPILNTWISSEPKLKRGPRVERWALDAGFSTPPLPPAPGYMPLTVQVPDLKGRQKNRNVRKPSTRTRNCSKSYCNSLHHYKYRIVIGNNPNTRNIIRRICSKREDLRSGWTVELSAWSSWPTSFLHLKTEHGALNVEQSRLAKLRHGRCLRHWKVNNFVLRPRVSYRLCVKLQRVDWQSV